MVSMALECKYPHECFSQPWADLSSYHGTSDLQLERMNVYFNEVGVFEASNYQIVKSDES